MRRTRAEIFADLERQHGKPAREVAIEAIKREGNLTRAAHSLGMSLNSFYYLLPYLGIQTRTVTRVERVSA